MIRNNLSLLLTERNLKITRVANDTGISRTTLTALNQNDNKMIQMDTINSLCKYLKVTPCDFFEYSPIDATFYFELGDSLTSKSDLNKGAPFMVEANGFINLTKFDKKIDAIEFTGEMMDIGPVDYVTNDSYIHGYSINLKPVQNIEDSIKELSIPFQIQLKDDFSSFVKKQLQKEDIEKNIKDKYDYGISISFESDDDSD
ncbi:helix-turn-helix domain-containing protein [Enterococcus sp. DIV0098]|uniref:helix-turn-helix domain-containing protein n=1 Tax=Enterococcus sp. DIV0098 TaxID=2774843 RepID=UPI003F2842DC